jgi:hypothetical protein
MRKYKCLSQTEYSNGIYSIKAISKDDIIFIKDIRNNQLDVLRQPRKLLNEEQFKYYRSIIEPQFEKLHPDQLLLSFLRNGQLIGYGGIVHLNWMDMRGEVSFLLSPERTLNEGKYRQEFKVFLSLICIIAFSELKLNRLFTETYDIRDNHILALSEYGFSLEGRMKEQVLIDDVFVDSLIHGLLRGKYDNKQ